MKINWIARVKNKAFWLSMIPALILFIQCVASLFGFTIDLGNIGDKLIQLVNTIFVILALLGIVTDPTTDGLEDSDRAMTYEEPYKDSEVN